MPLFGGPADLGRPGYDEVPYSARRVEPVVSLKPYEVEVNGVTTTLMLSDADAKARGLAEVVKKSAAKKAAPANKAVTSPANK